MNDVRNRIVEELELIWVCCGWRVDMFLFSCSCWHNTLHWDKRAIIGPDDGLCRAETCHCLECIL